MLIKAEAIGVNFIDTYFRSGLYPRELPFVVGTEVCGTVAAVGDDVAALSVGDRVVTAAGRRRLRRILPSPQPISSPTCPTAWPPDVAASALLKGMTAHYLIKSVYPVQQGDTVLVHAGAGGVGLILTQWATSLGAPGDHHGVDARRRPSCPGRPARSRCSTTPTTPRSSAPGSAS